MTRQVAFIVSQDTPSPGYPDYAKNTMVWLKPVLAGEEVIDLEAYQRQEDGTWKKLFSKGGDTPAVNFTSTISVGGDRGVSGTKVTPIGTLTFKEGILTGYSPP